MKNASSIAAAVCLAAAATAGCGVARGDTPLTGKELYVACQSCHGVAGEGNVALGAPSIAGLPRWYVASQLQRFQDGLRGKHPDDVEGLRMRAMSKQLLNKAEIDSVAGYVGGLTPVHHEPTLKDSNPSGSAVKFITCTGCHGQKGDGQEAMNAPPLAQLQDWYIAKQLTKFKNRVRGGLPNDVPGMTMQAMSMTLQGTDANDVGAYIQQSLAK